MNVNKISHTSWNCKYHVVFAPKYRRKAFYGSRKIEIGAILRKLCNWKGINIIEAEVCADHVHMLIEIPPKYSVSGIMGYLKGKSSLLIYERWGKCEVQVSEQRVLVQRILCRYGRKEYKKDNRIHKKSVKRRCGKQSINNGIRPIYG